jgi:two-component system, cell cycle response regulator DivK
MKTILVVDDNPICRELVTEALQIDGFHVVEASQGNEALDLIRRFSPDVMLLDIQMPDGSGYEILRQIRSDPGTVHLPVVALTAFAMRGDREKGLAEGFDDYITKPIDVDSLRRSIRRLLGERAPASGRSEQSPG